MSHFPDDRLDDGETQPAPAQPGARPPGAVGCALNGPGSEEEARELAEANATLRQALADLEARCAERTRERDEAEALRREEAQARQRAERALREQEAKLRTLRLVASATARAVVVADASGRVESVNRGFERLTGYSQDEARDRPLDAVLIGPGTDPDVAAFWRDRVRKGKAFRAEVRTTAKDGKGFLLALDVRPVRDDEGRVTHFVASQTGAAPRGRIGQRHRPEHRHGPGPDPREGERQFRTLADAAPVLIWMSDVSRGGVYFNRTWLEFTGRTLGQEAGTGWEAGIHPEDRARCREVHEWSFDRRHPFRVEYRLRRADGAYRWVLAMGVPRFGAGGLFEGYIGSCVDITERKQAEEARQQFVALVEHCSDFIAMTTAEGETLYVNPAGRALAGLGPDEPVTGTAFDDLLSVPGRALFRDVALPTALRDGQWWGEAALRDRTDGAERPMQHHLFVVRQAGSDRPLCLATIARDIAARKQVEGDLLRAREIAEEASRAKSAFLANMSHELRTPMAAVVGFGELLMNPALAAPLREEALKSIRRNGRHLMQLIEDILDLSKIEAGRMELEEVPYSPTQILDEVHSIMGARAAECGIALRVEALGRVPALSVTDPTRVRQVVLNFASNAIKFTEPGRKVTIRLYTREAEGITPTRFCFEVEDEGIGMSREQLGRLFRPFVQLDTSPARRFSGTGLGLSICKRLAEALRAKILVKSRQGRGTRFTLCLPVRPPEGGVCWIESPGLNPPRGPDPPSNLPQSVSLEGRVLVAEDSPDLSQLLRYQLTAAGLRVETAEDGREAVAKALANPFDVILMDMQMPNLDGYEATHALRRAGYGGPILALTAHAMRADRERCLQAGCTDYQAKPVDLPTLLGTVARFLGPTAIDEAVPVPPDYDPLYNGATTAELPTLSDPDRPLGDAYDSSADSDPAYLALVRDYAEALPTQLADLRAAQHDEDRRRVARVAHQVRGSGGMYGFPELSEVAGRLEDAAYAGAPDPDLAALLDAFEATCDLIRARTLTTPEP